jgi:WD40 repeat protein
MEDPSSFLSTNSIDPNLHPQIVQTASGDEPLVIGQVLGGIVVYGQLIYHGRSVAADSSTDETKATEIGPNPYRGLSAFREKDEDNFFGRDQQIKDLWEKFRNLYEDESSTRLLTIYGPSGCGKSSLARAGLIPELSRRNLPGHYHARVAVLVPGSDPLESLATVLARIATSDPSPVSKTSEFMAELSKANTEKDFDGLRRIANSLLEIDVSPLVVLVDQLEEMFTLCEDPVKQEVFISNLLCAAADRSKRVSVIITLRSDFLGAAQNYSQLNQLISSQGFLVAAMSEDGLREAIAKPAERAKHPLDLGTINLLIEQTKGREGALPLLQFALSQIWVGLGKDIKPAETLEKTGVGGILVKKAQEIYEKLDQKEKKIARRIFLGLVQLGEGAKDTRRRMPLERIVASGDSKEGERVKKVIAQFAHRQSRFITLATDGGITTAEVTHEALFDHWQQLKEWLKESRGDLRFQRRLDDAAVAWKEHGKEKGNLWRPPNLDLLKQHHEKAGEDMTPLQCEFFNASIDNYNAQNQAIRKADKEKKIQRRLLIALLSTGLVMTSGMAYHADRQSRIAEIDRKSSLAFQQFSTILADPINALLVAMESGQELERLLINKDSSVADYPTIQPVLALQTILDQSNLQNQIKTFQKKVNSITTFTPKGQLTIIATASDDGKIKLWQADGTPSTAIANGEIQAFVENKPNSKIKINSVRFNTEKDLIAIAGENGIAQIRNMQGELLREIDAHKGSGVRNIRFGNTEKGNLLVTSGRDGKVKLWNTEGKFLRELNDKKDKLAHRGGVEIVSLSNDDEFLMTGGKDKTAKLWSKNGKLITTFTGHIKTVKLARIDPEDTNKIITASEDDTVKIWDRSGKLKKTIQDKDGKGQGGINSVGFYKNLLITAGNNGTIKIWDQQGKLLNSFEAHKGRIETMYVVKGKGILVTAGQDDGIVRFWKIPDKSEKKISVKSLIGHKKSVNSIRFSPDNKQLVTASLDGTIRLWDLEGKGKKTFPNPAISKGFETVRFIDNGQYVMTGGFDSRVRFWDLNGRELSGGFDTKQGGIRSLGVSEKYISTAGYDRNVQLWKGNYLEGFAFYKKLSHEEKIVTNRFSPDGKFLAVVGNNGLFRIWNVDQIKHFDLKGHSGNVESVGFSPKGEKIATVGNDDTILLWSFSHSKFVLSNKIKTSIASPFQSVNFSPDGKLIATTTEDGRVQFWTLSGQQIADLNVHDKKIRSADFSSDGFLFATAGEDHKANISRVRSLPKLLNQGCFWLKDYLKTHSEDKKRLSRCP